MTDRPPWDPDGDERNADWIERVREAADQILRRGAPPVGGRAARSPAAVRWARPAPADRAGLSRASRDHLGEP
jgi:hypothetical protein